MKSVNKVILIGTLGKDPELKMTPGGTAVANFSIATNERYKDKSEQWQERTEWHNIVCWARLAEIANEYLKKGRQVYVEGSLKTESWEDKDSGQKRYKTTIVVHDLVLIGGKSEGAASGQRDEFDQTRPSNTARTAASGSNRASRPAAAAAAPAPAPAAIDDDDIPF